MFPRTTLIHCRLPKIALGPAFLTSKSFSVKHGVKNRKFLLMSSSAVPGYDYLECGRPEIEGLLRKDNVCKVLFVPYAQQDYDAHFKRVETVIKTWGLELESIHRSDPMKAIKEAEAIFVGGGNTFLLLKTLYDLCLMDLLRKRILGDGVPYVGSSAGSILAGPTIHTSNAMPVLYPPSFNALELIPFNINPHYTDFSNSHKTREERIVEYQSLPKKYPTYNVVGLREGGSLLIEDRSVLLVGNKCAKLFIRGKAPEEIPRNSCLSYLLQNK